MCYGQLCFPISKTAIFEDPEIRKPLLILNSEILNNNSLCNRINQNGQVSSASVSQGLLGARMKSTGTVTTLFYFFLVLARRLHGSTECQSSWHAPGYVVVCKEMPFWGLNARQIFIRFMFPKI